MTLLIISFIAGALTILAPCILPLLPVIIGGSVLKANEGKDDKRWLRPIVITSSLAISIVIFSLLIKATTLLLGVPQLVWQVISGIIVILLGINFLWPELWEKISARGYIRSNKLMTKAYEQKGIGGDILLGMSLGPVFSSCSPTYALIIAAILPASFIQGLTYLIAYAIGLSLVLLLVAFLGQSIIQKLNWLSNPDGWFKKFIGILFIVVGLAIILGLDKQFQTYVLSNGWYDPITKIERRFE